MQQLRYSIPGMQRLRDAFPEFDGEAAVCLNQCIHAYWDNPTEERFEAVMGFALSFSVQMKMPSAMATDFYYETRKLLGGPPKGVSIESFQSWALRQAKHGYGCWEFDALLRFFQDNNGADISFILRKEQWERVNTSKNELPPGTYPAMVTKVAEGENGEVTLTYVIKKPE